MTSQTLKTVEAQSPEPRRQIATGPGIDSARVLADLRVLSADDMEGRQVGTPGGRKARAFVVERFRAAGVLPFDRGFEQPFSFTTGRGTITGANVIGYVSGTGGPRAGTFIVVSAHYDHIGMQGGRVFNGADDNASGTAALFEIARYFQRAPTRHSLLFAAFDAEEEGLRGSQAFVAAPPVAAAAIALNLNADMIGREPNNTLYVVGTREQPFLKPAI
ncbi:MAG: M28 family peptidase, partial [Acidobacteriota bacterium]